MKKTILEKAAEVFKLPADVVAGLPKLEIVGCRELTVENHRGILSYDETEVMIGGGEVNIAVRGDGFIIAAMNARELRIEGFIFSVEIRYD